MDAIDLISLSGSNNNSTTTTSNISYKTVSSIEVELGWDYVLFAIVVAILALVGIVGNVPVLIVYFRNTNKNASYTFIKVLAFLDLLVCLFVMPYTIVYEYHIVKSDFACRFFELIRHAIVFGSNVTLVAVATERYIAVCRIGTRINVKMINYGVFIIFILSIIIAFPTVGIFAVINHDTEDVPCQFPHISKYANVCHFTYSLLGRQLVTIYQFIQMSLFFLELLIIIVLYTIVYVVLWRRTQIRKRMIVSRTSSCVTTRRSTRTESFFAMRRKNLFFCSALQDDLETCNTCTDDSIKQTSSPSDSVSGARRCSMTVTASPKTLAAASRASFESSDIVILPVNHGQSIDSSKLVFVSEEKGTISPNESLDGVAISEANCTPNSEYPKGSSSSSIIPKGMSVCYRISSNGSAKSATMTDNQRCLHTGLSPTNCVFNCSDKRSHKRVIFPDEEHNYAPSCSTNGIASSTRSALSPLKDSSTRSPKCVLFKRHKRRWSSNGSIECELLTSTSQCIPKPFKSCDNLRNMVLSETKMTEVPRDNSHPLEVTCLLENSNNSVSSSVQVDTGGNDGMGGLYPDIDRLTNLESGSRSRPDSTLMPKENVVPNTPSTDSIRKKSYCHRRTAKMLLLCTIVYFVTWMPFWLDIFGITHSRLFRYSFFIGNVSNPIIYGIVNARVRIAVKCLFVDTLCKCAIVPQHTVKLSESGTL